MSRYVDFHADADAVGRCIVLPGRQYTPDGPLLFFAAQAALMRGWDLRQVWWDPSGRGSTSVEEEVSWVGEQLDAAIDGYQGPVVVVAKSLGTLAVSRAADLGYPAAWLTPLLTEPDLAKAHLNYPHPQFVLIGSEDPYLDHAVFDSLPGDRHMVPGDHVLRVPTDPVAMVASHQVFVQAFDAWLGKVASGAR